MTEIIKEYFNLLGGDQTKFPEETEKRVLDFSKELLEKRKYEKFTTFDSDSDEMVILNRIKIFSFCEHHLLPYFGYCSIGYIPNGKVLGASKFQRLVDKISSKPSIQEGLTSEIIKKVESLLNPKGVALIMNCTHSCMFGRGINTSTITMRTQSVRGIMKTDSACRAEFLKGVRDEDLFR